MIVCSCFTTSYTSLHLVKNKWHKAKELWNFKAGPGSEFLCVVWMLLFQMLKLFQGPDLCIQEAGTWCNGSFLCCVHTALWLPWAFLSSLRFALDIRWTVVTTNEPWPLQLSSRKDTSNMTKLFFSLPQEKLLLIYLRKHRHRFLLMSYSVACWVKLIIMY